MSYFLMVILAGLVLGCTGRQESAPEPEETENIKQVALFEDHQRNRLVAFEFAPQTSVEEIRAHAESLRHTEDRLMGAYFFEQGARSISHEVLRRGFTIMRALDLLYDNPDIDPWRYAFMRPFVGEVKFVDCLETPQDALCRRD
ncbi:hypothetical protein M3027_04280 [Geoalkalibacter halelectricus]|nr:hypothetical protein [Geoalkalibacter halelectricus]